MRLILVLVICALASAFRGGSRQWSCRQQPVSLRLSTLSDAETTPSQVFIGNMPFTLSEGELKDLVVQKLGGETGSFSGIKIAMDRTTGKSRGFGYVNFAAKEDAEAAVSKLSGLSVDGREFRVDLSVPKEQRPARATGSSSDGAPRRERPMLTPADQSVFIGNLDFSVTDVEILAMCNDILGEGVASKVRLAVDRESGRPRGFGHIDFATPDDAKKAIELLNGIELAGRDLRVDAAQRKEDRPARTNDRFGGAAARTGDRPPRSNSDQKNSVFLGNLAWDVTTEIVEDMVNDIIGPGLFTQVRLAVERDTGKMRGFGHIDFKDQASAEKAVNELNGMQVMGRQIRADHAQKKEGGGGGGGRFGGGGGGDRYANANNENSGSFGAW